MVALRVATDVRKLIRNAAQLSYRVQPAMMIRPGTVYVYDPSLPDRCEGRAFLHKGDLVRVRRLADRLSGYYQEIENLRGSANHCYVETLDGKTVCLISCESLVSRRSPRAKEILLELRRELADLP